MGRQMNGDVDAVIAVATGYFESYFHGDVEGMRSVLHPDLAKRARDPGTSESALDQDTAEGMVDLVARGSRPRDEHGQEVTLLDLDGDIASVKVVSKRFVEYLHLARFGGRWLIVNALYEPR